MDNVYFGPYTGVNSTVLLSCFKIYGRIVSLNTLANTFILYFITWMLDDPI